MKCVRLFLFLFSWIALLERGAAQTPSELAASYFEVLQREDYKTAASYFDEAMLKEFRGMMDFLKELPDNLSQDVYPQFFGEGQTKASVAALPDVEFFARFLGGIMAQAKAFGDVLLDKMEVLGEVPEGENVVHVLTRSRAKVGEMEIEGMEVISFHRVNGKWKALLSGKMKGMAAQLKTALLESGPAEMEVSPVRLVPEGPAPGNP